MEETNSVLLKQIYKLFGILDETPDRAIDPPPGSIVFTTNIFVPMEGRINQKTFLYLSGFVKMVETFEARTKACSGDEKPVYLHVYYDSMFDKGYDDTKYRSNESQNNNLNKEIKGNYKYTQEILKKLLRHYYEYLQKIKFNAENKYKFVRLFSFNCRHLKTESKGYLGHTDTFGAVVRFITLLNPYISTTFSMNGRNPLTPRLCFFIRKWLESGKVVLTNNNHAYLYDDNNKNLFNNYLLKLNDDDGTNVTKVSYGYQDFISNFSDLPSLNERLKKLEYSRICKYRPLAGVVGINGCNETTKQLLLRWFYKIMMDLLFLHNKYHKRDINPFQYGFDELILGILFNEMKVDGSDEHQSIVEDSRKINQDFVHPYEHNRDEAQDFRKYKRTSFFSPSHSVFENDQAREKSTELKESHLYLEIPQEFKKYINIVLLDININLEKIVSLSLQNEDELNRLIEKLRLLRDEICTLYNMQNDKQSEKFNSQQMRLICNGIINPYEMEELNIFQNQETREVGVIFLSRLGILNYYERHKMIKPQDEISRKIFQELGEEPYVEDFLSNQDGKYSLVTLLFCFDELKPLRICLREEDCNPYVLPFSEYNTKIFIGDPHLVDKMVEHYSNTDKTLPVPYTMKELPTAAGAAGGSSQAGGFKKNLKLTKKYKKTDKKRKSRYNKKHTKNKITYK